MSKKLLSSSGRGSGSGGGGGSGSGSGGGGGNHDINSLVHWDKVYSQMLTLQQRLWVSVV